MGHRSKAGARSSRRRFIGAASASHFKPTVIATSVAFAFSAPGALAQWKPNAEIYIKPGDDRSYIGAEGVVPLWQTGTALLFGDLKAKLGEHDTHEFNLGLAYRQFTASQAWAWGGYLAYDRRRARSGHDFNQATVGAEARSEAWDFRVNYYHPTSDKHLLGVGAASFQDFRVFRNGIYEEAMRGADVEVGALLPFTGKIETRVFLAGYTYKAEDLGTHADGARLRFEVRPRQDIILGLSVQHDNLFKTAWYVEARYAFGKAPQQGVRKLTDRMTDPWTRDTDIVITPATESPNIALAQQQPGRVVHVDSSKPAGGDGSFERPYNLVATCEAAKCGPTGGTYNLVRLWHGNSGATPYTPVTLQPGRTLWGEGLDIYTNVASPALRPIIAGAGDAITLVPGSNFTVVGVDARSTGGRAVFGGGVTGDIVVRDSALSGLTHGIHVTTNGGTANTTISGNTITANNPAGNSYGILLSNSAAGGVGTSIQTATISGNTITSATGGAGSYTIGISLANQNGLAAGGTATQTVTITGNTITATQTPNTNFGVAIRHANYGGGSGSVSQTTTISGNTIRSSGGIAFGVSSYGGSSNAGGTMSQAITISGNTLSQTGVDRAVGVLINPVVNQATPYIQNVTVSGNTIGVTSAGTEARSIQILNTTGGGGSVSQNLLFSGNNLTATNTAGEATGILLNVNQVGVGSNSTQTSSVTGNTIRANAAGAGNGVQMTGPAGTQTTTLSGNTISRTGATGATVSNTGPGTCTGGGSGAVSCP